MTIKLFTIGDSVSQGFMSFAAARTDLAYSTLIAEKLGLTQPEYRIPRWESGGLPVNAEILLRDITARVGSAIGPLEWPNVVLKIRRFLDEVEDYYEREEGRADHPYQDEYGTPEFFHNVASYGLTVADAWQLTPELCQRYIEKEDSEAASGLFDRRDGNMAIPSASFYRSALKVLNPSLRGQYMRFSALDWLAKHSDDQGIENLALWLGGNNALGTIIRLKIHPTNNDPARRPHLLSFDDRTAAGWNLWHPADFAAEYNELLTRVDQIMRDRNNANAPNWKVFLSTIPMLTIAPLAKGVGTTYTVHRPDAAGNLKPNIYYKYYTYFLFEEEFAHRENLYLPLQHALYIDDTIRAYNRHIKQRVQELNDQHGNERYFIVDIAEQLDQLAFKRNSGNPQYQMPPYLQTRFPLVNTKYYHASRQGYLLQGGIVSLDGIHPSAIGQGLVAYEFLREMERAGVVADTELDWPAIFESDTLYRDPIPIMSDLYDRERLAGFLIDWFMDD